MLSEIRGAINSQIAADLVSNPLHRTYPQDLEPCRFSGGYPTVGIFDHERCFCTEFPGGD